VDPYSCWLRAVMTLCLVGACSGDDSPVEGERQPPVRNDAGLRMERDVDASTDISASAAGNDGGIDCNDLAPTPGGPIARACVHEVPNGATESSVDGGFIVTLNGKIVDTYGPCPCPPPSRTRDAGL
jgi:hypothetical protein